MARRAVIIGGGGQLGGAASIDFHAAGWEVIVPSRDEVDVEDAKKTAESITALNPDVVLNCAWLPVLDCEKDVARAYRINALGAHSVARGAAQAGALVIHISTDYVFDGSIPEGVNEKICPRPLNIYGASKLAGEHLVAIANPRHYIVRTSALFGLHAKPLGNFLLKMKARADAGEKTQVVNDQITKPTFAEDLAPLLRDMIERETPSGLYHATNEGTATWYDLAREVFAHEGKSELITPVATVPDPSGIIRPQYSILKSDTLATLGFKKLPSWKDAVARYLEQLS